MRTAQPLGQRIRGRGGFETLSAAVNSTRPSVECPCEPSGAADQIAKLAKKARSESVRLAGARSMLSDMMAVSVFAGLEERLAKLEEQDRARHEENAPGAN